MSFRTRSFKFDNVFKTLKIAGTTVLNVTEDESGNIQTPTVTGNLSANTLSAITSLENFSSIIVNEVEISSQTIKNRVDGHNLILEATGSGVVQINDAMTVKDVSITGNLTVNGTTTTVTTTNTNISDALILLSHGASGAPTKDAGLIIERGSSVNAGLIWDESADQFSVITTTVDATTVGDITISNYANLQVNILKATDLQYANGTSIISTINSTIDTDISTANLNMKGYVDGEISTINSDLSTLESNAASQANQLTDLDTNKASLTGADFTGNVSVGSTVLFVNTLNNRIGIGTDTPGWEVEVVGNLAISEEFIGNGSQLTGNLTAGGVLTNNYYYANGTPFVGGASTLDGLSDTDLFGVSTDQVLRYSGASLAWVNTDIKTINSESIFGSGDIVISGGGTYTADSSAPGSPSSGDFWYNTSTDIIYQYIDDGTSSYWVDRSSESRYIDQTYNNAVYSGNVTATRFIGDGSQLTGLPESYSNAQVTSHLLTYTGNITAGNITVSGTMTAGSIVETSTMRIKENINPIINGLDAILNLKGVTYNRLDNHKHEAGLIAEQVNKVLPDLVAKDADGNPSAIQYTKLTAYLIEAIKELNAEIEKLKGKR